MRRRSRFRLSGLTLVLVLTLSGLPGGPASDSLAGSPGAAPRPRGRTAVPTFARPRPVIPPQPPAPVSLTAALRSRLSRASLRGGRAGFVVISLRDGRAIYEWNADRPLSPASTMKVLTSAAILDKLGPDWRYRTPFLADAPPADGVIAGNLYVKGVCEPDLVVERFPELAAGLAAAGVREIHGDLIADLQYFDGEERPPEWPDGDNPNPYAAPISALAANFSSVRVTVLPGPRAGAPATVLVEPPSDALPVSASVRTVASGGTSIHAYRKLEKTQGSGGVTNRIVATGRIGRFSAPWEIFIPIENPATVAISAVRRALQDGGVEVRGQARLGETPAGAAPVYTLTSRVLADIVSAMNKNSNNFIAEMTLRTLGAEVYGPPGSREKGRDAVAAFLRTCRIDPDVITLTDGSGLSRSNLLTANTLARVLVRMWGDPRVGPAFVASLPIAGVDGTLKRRMNGLTLGRVRAKTGTIDGVTALAGYVEDTREGPVAFAFLVNGVSHPRAVRLLDDLCRILCSP